MTVQDEKLIHIRKLFAAEKISPQMGYRVLDELKKRGLINPEITPSGRVFVSANEAQRVHEALRR